MDQLPSSSTQKKPVRSKAHLILVAISLLLISAPVIWWAIGNLYGYFTEDPSGAGGAIFFAVFSALFGWPVAVVTSVLAWSTRPNNQSAAFGLPADASGAPESYSQSDIRVARLRRKAITLTLLPFAFVGISLFFDFIIGRTAGVLFLLVAIAWAVLGWPIAAGLGAWAWWLRRRTPLTAH